MNTPTRVNERRRATRLAKRVAALMPHRWEVKVWETVSGCYPTLMHPSGLLASMRRWHKGHNVEVWFQFNPGIPGSGDPLYTDSTNEALTLNLQDPNAEVELRQFVAQVITNIQMTLAAEAKRLNDAQWSLEQVKKFT